MKNPTKEPQNMTPTHHKLPCRDREVVGNELNTILAHLQHLHLVTKQAHWNIRGDGFIGVHRLLDKIDAELLEQIDESAERVEALGVAADATLEAIQKKSAIKNYPVGVRCIHTHLESLSAAYALVSEAGRKVIETADKHNDPGTADHVTGMTEQLDKWMWLIESNLPQPKDA